MPPIFSRPQISSPAIAELCDAPVPQELAKGDHFGVPALIHHKQQSYAVLALAGHSILIYFDAFDHEQSF